MLLRVRSKEEGNVVVLSVPEKKQRTWGVLNACLIGQASSFNIDDSKIGDEVVNFFFDNQNNELTETKE